MKVNKMSKRKLINGKLYTYKASYRKKYDALSLAKAWRKSGYNARVVPTNGRYVVYVKKRR